MNQIHISKKGISKSLQQSQKQVNITSITNTIPRALSTVTFVIIRPICHCNIFFPDLCAETFQFPHAIANVAIAKIQLYYEKYAPFEIS